MIYFFLILTVAAIALFADMALSTHKYAEMLLEMGETEVPNNNRVFRIMNPIVHIFRPSTVN